MLPDLAEEILRHSSIEETRARRLCRVIDRFNSLVLSWAMLTGEISPYLPQEFHGRFARMHHEFAQLLDEYSECMEDLAETNSELGKAYLQVWERIISGEH